MRAPSLITLGFVMAFTLFNLQPYVGLRFLSCQTMYSGLSPLPPGNHLFLPRLRWFDNGNYLVSARLGDDRVHAYLNLEYVRRELQQRCEAGQPVSLEFVEAGVPRHIDDACADPEYSRPKHGLWARFGYPASLGDSE
jgi:hypothetical protein